MRTAASLRYILPFALVAWPTFADPVVPECRAGAPTICILTDRDTPQALIALTLPVGAADEAEGGHGIAHYVEHLTFRTRGVEDDEMTSAASGIDSYGNAYTGSWATTYHWQVPAGRAAEAARRAMAVLMPLDASAAAADEERAIVAREREEREDSSGTRDGLTVDPVLYGGTPLARTVIGTADEIDALSLDTARAFHDRHYDRAGAVLILAGDVEWADVEGLAESGTPSRRRAPRIVVSPAEPSQMSREDVVQRPERWQVSLIDLPHGPETPPALAVVQSWLGSSLSGAPWPVLVRGRDDTGNAWADIYEVAPGIGGFAAGVTLRPGLPTADLNAPWNALRGLIDGLAQHGLDAKTVERLRIRLHRDELRTREDGILAAWSLIGSLEAREDIATWTSLPERLAAVTPQDVNDVLSALATPRRSVTLDTLPISPSSALETTP